MIKKKCRLPGISYDHSIHHCQDRSVLVNSVILRVNAPPLPDRLFELDMSTAKNMPAPKWVALYGYRQGLSENVSFGICHENVSVPPLFRSYRARKVGPGGRHPLTLLRWYFVRWLYVDIELWNTLNPFRTPVPFWGHTTQNPSSLSSIVRKTRLRS